MILLIDNYDSFTYNLFHYLGELGADVRVFLNDKITLDEIENLAPEKIVISPGPCTPKEAGISCAVVSQFAERVPILGVCLGHQCIGAAYGGEIIICHDAAYTEIAFDGYQPMSLLQVDGARDVAIEFHSLSKTFNMTGWRIGMAVGNSDLISGGQILRPGCRICPPQSDHHLS